MVHRGARAAGSFGSTLKRPSGADRSFIVSIVLYLYLSYAKGIAFVFVTAHGVL